MGISSEQLCAFEYMHWIIFSIYSLCCQNVFRQEAREVYQMSSDTTSSILDVY